MNSSERTETAIPLLAALDLAPGRIDELADMPWGMREFHLWDPHGNLLRIGQVIGDG